MLDSTDTPTSVFSPQTEGSLRDRYEQGLTFEEFLPTADENAEMYAALWQRARVSDTAIERAAAIPGRWHLLVLSIDGCGDSVNTLPVLARLAGAVPTLSFRMLQREEHPDLMDAHLTNGRSRSVPVVMFLDEDYVERGWWGPRPAELQQWVMEEGLKLDSAERYKIVRRWYARDKGATAVDEVLSGIEAAAAGDL